MFLLFTSVCCQHTLKIKTITITEVLVHPVPYPLLYLHLFFSTLYALLVSSFCRALAYQVLFLGFCTLLFHLIWIKEVGETLTTPRIFGAPCMALVFLLLREAFYRT